MAWLSKVTFLGEEELNNSGCQSHGGDGSGRCGSGVQSCEDPDSVSACLGGAGPEWSLGQS